jgi:hypothetical protein
MYWRVCGLIILFLLAAGCGSSGEKVTAHPTPNVGLIIQPGATIVETRELSGPKEEGLFVLVSEGPRESPVLPKTRFDILVKKDKKADWVRIVGLDASAYPEDVILGDVTGDGIDEIIFSTRQGSGGFLDYWVYGFVDGKLQLLLDKTAVFQGSLQTTATGLLEAAGNLTTLYSWNGTAFVGTRVTAPQQPVANGQALHYSIQEPARGGRAIGASQVTLKVGQSLHLVRDDLTHTSERILYSANGVIESSGKNTWKAIKPGDTDITVIPGGYDWDKSLKITVTVTP